MSIKHLGGDRYQVRLYNPVGKEYRRVVRGKRNATAHEAEMRMRMAGGLDPSKRRIPFKTYAVEHLDARPQRRSTRSRYDRALEKYVYPWIGHRPIAGIRYTDLVYLTGTWRHLAPSTQRGLISALRMIFRAAELDGLVARNPAAALALPRQPRKQKRMPTWSEVRHLIEHAQSPSTAAAAATVALTGIRSGELSGLRVADLDMLRGILHVRRQYLRSLDTGEWYVADPKTHDSARAVPMPPALVDILAAYLAAHPVEDGAFIFPFLLGDRLRYPARRLLDWNLYPHALRHLYTTTLHNAGVPLTTIDEVTGHAPQGITLGVYSHPTDESRSRVREVMQDVWLRAADDSASSTGPSALQG